MRALVLEDQDLMRFAIMDQIAATFEKGAIIGADTLELALAQLGKDEFNLVVIDPGLPGFDPLSDMDRLNVVRTVINTSPLAIHIVITGNDTSQEANAFRNLGAAAYLAKTGLSPANFSEALGHISSLGFYKKLACTDMQVADHRFPCLTQREQQIVDLMIRRAPGMSRNQIYEMLATQLKIDTHSAEKYFKNARSKLTKSGHRLPQGF